MNSSPPLTRFTQYKIIIELPVIIAMKKKILVADDEPAICEALELMLEDAGYEVETTTNGETAKMMSEVLPNLLLLDVWMSGTDGRKVCAYLKAQPHTKHIPIIMVSATRDLEKSAKEAGAEDFISKPFEMSELLEKVRKFTSNAD